MGGMLTATSAGVVKGSSPSLLQSAQEELLPRGVRERGILEAFTC